MKRILLIFFLFVTAVAQAQVDKVIPQKPNPPKLVNDFTGTLTSAQVEDLEQKLVAYDDSTSNQVAIVIVNSLQGYSVEEFALAVGRSWGVGGKQFSNGVVLLVAMQDHKSRIEVGYGLEGAIPDITAGHILENDITPNFKQGNYYRGLDAATDDIIRAAAGEYKAPENYGGKKSKGVNVFAIIIIIIAILIAIGRGKGPGGTYVSRGGFGGWGGLGGWGGGGGGWSGGGGGGGGFGGFGGGSFGGGGASGSW